MSVPTAALPALFAIVLAAFAVEAAIGFGATVVTVALGSLLVPIEVILPAFVPLNVVLSAWLALRYRRDVAARLLFRRMLPLMALGLPAGIAIFRTLGEGRLKAAFGAFVALLAATELVRQARARRVGAAAEPGVGAASGALRSAALVLGGVAHGAFATGGPLAVWVAGQELRDPRAFRSTLSALWLLLNLALVATYVASGALGAASLRTSGALAAALALGLAAGEWAHRRVPAATFRALVFALLGATGVLLAARG